jgi:transposase
MFQNAGEKGTPQREMEDPPRRRANNRKGLGTRQNDRPPIQGVGGRTSGQIRLTVCDNTQQQTIQPRVEHATAKTSAVYTDESHAYNHLAETGRTHQSVCHSQGEYARDDDAMGSAKSTATPGKAFGPDCATSSAPFGAYIKRIWPRMWPFLNGRTT